MAPPAVSYVSPAFRFVRRPARRRAWLRASLIAVSAVSAPAASAGFAPEGLCRRAWPRRAARQRPAASGQPWPRAEGPPSSAARRWLAASAVRRRRQGRHRRANRPGAPLEHLQQEQHHGGQQEIGGQRHGPRPAGDVFPHAGQVQALAAAGGLGQPLEGRGALARLLRQVLGRIGQAHRRQRGLAHAGGPRSSVNTVSLPARGISARRLSGDDQPMRVVFGTAALARPGRERGQLGQAGEGGGLARRIEVQLDAAHAVAKLLRGHHAGPEPLLLAGGPAGQRGEEVAHAAPAGHRRRCTSRRPRPCSTGPSPSRPARRPAPAPGTRPRRPGPGWRRAAGSRGCSRRSAENRPAAAG